MKVYIKKDKKYFRVYYDIEIITIHHFHSEKLNKENAKRLKKELLKK